ncbi:MAG: hypothetical protein OEY81_02300 [Candidatus Bathyarchaeota archaeon]|nr:hypothetical protein [Candidatus Bathyarchaeota archaeon]
MKGNREVSILDRFLQRLVTVKAGELTISGVLVGYDRSSHNPGGIGNLILRDSNGETIVRGKLISSVGIPAAAARKGDVK